MSKSLERILEVVWLAKCEGSDACKTVVHADAFLRRHAHMEPKNDGLTPNPWRRNMDYSEWEQSPYYGSVSDFMKKFPGGIREWLDWRNKGERERWTMFFKPVGEYKKTAAIEDDEPFHELSEEEEEEEEEEEYEPTEEEMAEAEREPTEEEREAARKLTDKALALGLVPLTEEDIMKEVEKLRTREYGPKLAHFVPVGEDDVPSLGEKEHPLYSDRGLQKFKSVREFLKQYRQEGQSADDAAMRAVRDMVDYWKLLLKGKRRRQKKSDKESGE